MVNCWPMRSRNTFTGTIYTPSLASLMEDRMRINQLPNKTTPDRGGFYFFHLKCGQVVILDQIGLELPDMEEAAKEAARRGREIAKRGPLQGVAGGSVIVADEQWRPIFEVPADDGDA